MEAQIKEEAKEASLCFETSSDNLASISLVEKYDRFIQNDNSELDSDGDFFPDDAVLREEYAQLTSDTANYARAKNNRLSTGLPGKYTKSTDANCSTTEETDNGTTSTTGESPESGDTRLKLDKSGLETLNELIDKLNEVRKCDPDGNSIFCDEHELEAIQERYGAILDFIHDKTCTFEQTSSPKDSDNEEQVDVGNANENQLSDSMKLLTEKMLAVQQARDNFYDVEQQVREQIEQLELVERYKMESVG